MVWVSFRGDDSVFYMELADSCRSSFNVVRVVFVTVVSCVVYRVVFALVFEHAVMSASFFKVVLYHHRVELAAVGVLYEVQLREVALVSLSCGISDVV